MVTSVNMSDASSSSSHMVLIPPGRYRLGSSARDVASALTQFFPLDESLFKREVPRRTFVTAGFYLGRYAVTNREYEGFIAAGGYHRDEFWCKDGLHWRNSTGRLQPRFFSLDGWSEAAHPVVGVTWFEASAYCRWKGGHLPTEWEWEVAARGQEGTIYSWGNIFDVDACNTSERWVGRNFTSHEDWLVEFWSRRPWRHQVLTLPTNRAGAPVSCIGAVDMNGNTWEWCANTFRTSGGEPRERALRGGSFGYPGWAARSTDRGHHVPAYESLAIGFRCAYSIGATCGAQG